MTAPASPSATRRDLFAAPLLLLLLGSMWGASFSVSKFSIQGGVPVLGYAAWQAAGSALVLMLILRLRGAEMPRGLRVWRYSIISGLVGISIPNLIFFSVISHMPAGLMAVIVTTAPIITYALALTIRIEGLSWLRGSGIALGFVGALVIVLPSDSLPEDVDLLWVLLGFLTPAFYALSTLYAGQRRPPGASSGALACGMLMSAGVAQTLIMVTFDPIYVPLPPWGLPELAILVQIAISASAYVIYFHILQLTGPVYVSQVGYIVTVTGILWGMAIFGEQLSYWVFAGTALIMLGFSLVNAKRGAHPSAGAAR